MTAKTTYRTKQQRLLLAYLQETQGAHVTAEEICAHFAAANTPIGIATIYRQLDRLVSDGTVSKYFIDDQSAACFAYQGSRCPSAPELHFHLKCESCGTLIHLECEELACIQGHLLREHGFALNPFRTVFYGICAQCAEKAPAQESRA